MEETAEMNENSISMGPVAVISGNSELFGSPNLSNALDNLSISAITPIDTSQQFHIMTTSLNTPETANVLASTMHVIQQASVSIEDLSISMGPLPSPSKIETSLQHIEIDSIPKTQTILKKLAFSVQVQTDLDRTENELLVEKLKNVQDELIQVREEKERYIATQQLVIDEYRTEASNAQKQIEDLKVQLEAADKQLKASRAFLEQQAEDREQEREEAMEHLKRLQVVVVEKEKERERENIKSEQLMLEIQVLEKQLLDRDTAMQEHMEVQQKLETQVTALLCSKSETDEELKALQQLFELKSELLDAQALQVAALSKELEDQLLLRQQLMDEINALKEAAKQNQPQELNDTVQSSDISLCRNDCVTEVPSLFAELQALTYQLTRKVDQRIRELESVHYNSSNRLHNSTLISPRSVGSSSPITEDVSLKDRTGLADSLENLSQSPLPDHFHGNPDVILSSLQQLEAKLTSLCRIEETAYKRIADLEAELHRVSSTEKKSNQAAVAAEKRCAEHQREIEELKSERLALQHEYAELLRKISLLENRLEEQRRNPALSAAHNEQKEKLKQLWEEKQQLLETLQSKSDVIAGLQQQLQQLKYNSKQQEKRKDQEIDELRKEMQKIRDTFQTSVVSGFGRLSPAFSDSSEEHMRKAPVNEDGTLPFSRITPFDSELKQLTPGQEHSRVSHKQQLETEPEKLADLQPSFDLTESSSTDSGKSSMKNEVTALKAVLETKESEIAVLQKAQDNCFAVEARLTEQLKRIEELEAAVQHTASLEAALAEKATYEESFKTLQQHCTALEEKLQLLEAALEDKQKQIDDLLSLKSKLEAEKTSLEEAIQKAKAANKQDAESLKAAERSLAELTSENAELKLQISRSEGAKSKVENVLQQLQGEVDFLKRHLQQMEENQKISQQQVRLAGPPAPPDLLAPSFIEFLGSPSSSSHKSSSSIPSRPNSALLHPAESTLDCSLPSSVPGKKVLKSVQQESQQLLLLSKKVFGKQLQQQDLIEEEDLDSTLTPQNVQQLAAEEKWRKREQQLLKRVEILETQLSIEKLLVRDQRAANSLKQQQIMELSKALSQQRVTQQSSSLTRNSALQIERPLPLNSKMGDLQYRYLKAESFRKNLIYQKKFLIGITGNLCQQVDQTLIDSSRINRFRSRVWVVIAVLRLRFIVRLWRRRRQSAS